MDIEKFKELLKLRRDAKDEEEKALIDKAIQKMLDEPQSITYTPSYTPWYAPKYDIPCYQPIMCKA